MVEDSDQRGYVEEALPFVLFNSSTNSKSPSAPCAATPPLLTRAFVLPRRIRDQLGDERVLEDIARADRSAFSGGHVPLRQELLAQQSVAQSLARLRRRPHYQRVHQGKYFTSAPKECTSDRKFSICWWPSVASRKNFYRSFEGLACSKSVKTKFSTRSTVIP